MRRPSAIAARALPILGWARGYRRSWARDDLAAGGALAVMLVPQGMAYAALAGTPAITGLYAALVSLVVYAVLGTSSHVNLGPTAVISLLTASALSTVPDTGDVGYVALAGLMALLVGGIQLVMGVLRLGMVVNVLSRPVISGFTSGAGVVIAASQVWELLGLEPHHTDGVIETVGLLASRIADLHPVTLGIGLVSLGLLLGGRRWVPRLPTPLLVVVGSTATVWALDLHQRGVAILRDVPSGLPASQLPAVRVDLILELLPLAAVIAIIGFAETISVGKAVAARTRERLDSNRELIASGACNAAAGSFGGIPVAGSFTRTAVAYQAGARTPAAGLVAAGGLALALLLLTPLFFYMPRAVLAAIVIMAVGGLVDVRGAVAILRLSRRDGGVLLATFLATIGLGVEIGIAAGVALSLAVFLRDATRVRLTELGRVVGTNTFRDIRRYDTRTDPRVAVLRLDSPVHFMNAPTLVDRVNALIAGRQDLRWLVVDAGAMADLDATAADALHTLHDEFAHAGVEVHLASLRGPARDRLRHTPDWNPVAAGHHHPDLPSAFAASGVPDDSPLRRVGTDEQPPSAVH